MTWGTVSHFSVLHLCSCFSCSSFCANKLSTRKIVDNLSLLECCVYSCDTGAVLSTTVDWATFLRTCSSASSSRVTRACCSSPSLHYCLILSLLATCTQLHLVNYTDMKLSRKCHVKYSFSATDTNWCFSKPPVKNVKYRIVLGRVSHSGKTENQWSLHHHMKHKSTWSLSGQDKVSWYIGR